MEKLDSPGKRLKWARENRTGYKTATEAARAFGWTVPTYLGHENGDRNPSRVAAKRYAQAYRVPVEWIFEGGHLPDAAERSETPSYDQPAGDVGDEMFDVPPPSNAEITAAAPPLPLRQEMDKDVPVYGTVVGGDLGNHADFELNGTIVDYVRRPPRLRGRADIFAAYTQGESMLYWREPGQLIYFEKARPPRAMDYVLVELKPHNGDEVRPALIKRLLAVTPTKIRLRQYNPPKDFEIDRSKVYQLVRVIDWDELMAV